MAFNNVLEKSNIVFCLQGFSPDSQISLSHTDLDCLVTWGGLLHKNPANRQVFSKQRLCNHSNIEVFHLFAVKWLFCLLAAPHHPQRCPGWLLLKVLAMSIHLSHVYSSYTRGPGDQNVCPQCEISSWNSLSQGVVVAHGVWRIQDCLGYGLLGMDGWCRTNIHFFPSLMGVYCLLVKLPVSQNHLF